MCSNCASFPKRALSASLRVPDIDREIEHAGGQRLVAVVARTGTR